MSSDMELLRQRKALELRRKMLLSKDKAPPVSVEAPVPNARDTVRRVLTGRGVEVLDTARRYYPREIAELEKNLANLIMSRSLKGPISGEQLYAFLRRVGFVFSMDVKIRVKEHGELKSLEEKFRQTTG